MLKVTRLEVASLPYVVFISKVLHHFNIDCVESCETYGKRNDVDKNALHHMGFRHGVDGWVFKDKNYDKKKLVLLTVLVHHLPPSDQNLSLKNLWSDNCAHCLLSTSVGLINLTRILLPSKKKWEFIV